MKFGDDCGCIGNRNNRSEIIIWKSSCQLIYDRHKHRGETYRCKESANSQCRNAAASLASQYRNAKKKACDLADTFDDRTYNDTQKIEAYCKG